MEKQYGTSNGHLNGATRFIATLAGLTSDRPGQVIAEPAATHICGRLCTPPDYNA